MEDSQPDSADFQFTSVGASDTDTYEELRSLCEEAGLKNIDIQGHTRSVMFEGGVGQVIRCLEATPISAKIPEDKRDTFAQELETRLEPLLDRDIVQSPTFSHIILAQP